MIDRPSPSPSSGLPWLNDLGPFTAALTDLNQSIYPSPPSCPLHFHPTSSMNHRSPRCRHHQGVAPTLPAPCHKGRGGGVASSRLLGSSPNRCLPKQAPLPTTHRCVLSTRDNNQPFTCHAPIGLDHPNSAIIIFHQLCRKMHAATNSIASAVSAVSGARSCVALVPP